VGDDVTQFVRTLSQWGNADLMFDTRILSFRIFTNENRIDVIVRCLVSLDRYAWPDVGEEVERSPKSQIEGNVTLSDCRRVGQVLRRSRCFEH
jgi:hypothetical protein